jgi:hypothetical protein
MGGVITDILFVFIENRPIRSAEKSVVVRCNRTPFNPDFLPFTAFRFGKIAFQV